MKSFVQGKIHVSSFLLNPCTNIAFHIITFFTKSNQTPELPTILGLKFEQVLFNVSKSLPDELRTL